MKDKEIIQHLTRRVEELEKINLVLSRVALNLSAERQLNATLKLDSGTIEKTQVKGK